MKILHFMDGIGPGGKERRLIELLKGLEKNNIFSSELALMSRKIHYREIHDLDVKIHKVSLTGLSQATKNILDLKLKNLLVKQDEYKAPGREIAFIGEEKNLDK